MSTSVRTRAHPRAAARGFALLAFVALAWGVNWPVMKFLLGEIRPFQMRALTCVVGAAFALSLAGLSGERLRPPMGQWRPLLQSSALNFTAFMICSISALHWLSASEAVIVAYTLPIWAALIAWPVLGERPTVRRIAALLIGLAGVVVLVAADFRASWDKLPGIGFGLAGAILFALGMVLAKRRPIAMPPVASVGWQVLLSAPPLALLMLTTERIDVGHVTPLGWLALGYLAIVPLCLAYVAWFQAVRLLPASVAAVATLLVPIVGVGSAALLLGEPLGAREFLALGLTLGGVAIAARS